jgi:hypothetical protein
MRAIATHLRVPRWREVLAAESGVRLGDLFLIGVTVVLLGYAIGGRGFAYIGLPPLFIGEVVLLLGLAATFCCRHWKRLLGDARLWPMLIFCGWGILRTVPFLSSYQFDAVRDAVIWIYAAYAFAIVAVLTEVPTRFTGFVLKYRSFFRWFLLCLPVVFCIYRLLGAARPEWPWVAVPIVQIKEGDVLVHLAGVMAFWVSGLGGRPSLKYVVILTVMLAATGVVDRAGTVAFGLVFFLSLLYRPGNLNILRVVLTVLVAVVLLWASGLRVELEGGKGRDISFDQILININSVLFDTGSDGLDSTKEWRLDWWKEIASYTLNGPYFFTGKGYGINLADDDGFQVLADGSLRNPHSIHLNILARSGVPGLATWVLVQGVWALLVLRAFFQSRVRGYADWSSLFFFLFCYWCALMVNGSFDVYIEGPPGGIWLWSVYGTGLAAVILYGRDPSLFTAQVPPQLPQVTQ